MVMKPVPLHTSRSPRARDELVLASANGRLRFTLRRCDAGLMVQRCSATADGERVLQVLSLPHEDALDQWCDDDPSRFDDPLLLSNVKRCGRELLQQPANSTDAARALQVL